MSVKTSDEAAVLEVDGGVLYLTINKSRSRGSHPDGAGCPQQRHQPDRCASRCPPALVKVRIPMSGDMLNDAYQYQRKNREVEMVDKGDPEEEEIVRSDRHTERIKEILRTTALGQVPAGFTLADDPPKCPEVTRCPASSRAHQQTRTEMVGAREYIDVVLVSNNTTYESNIKEEMCLSRDALAVGVMDAAALSRCQHGRSISRGQELVQEAATDADPTHLDNNGTFI